MSWTTIALDAWLGFLCGWMTVLLWRMRRQRRDLDARLATVDALIAEATAAREIAQVTRAQAETQMRIARMMAGRFLSVN